MNKLKADYTDLQSQQNEFTNRGLLLKNLLGVSIKHPFLSLAFIVVLGVLTNTLFELVGYFVSKSDYSLSVLVLLTLVYVMVLVWILVHIKGLHRDLFKPLPLKSKKVLVTLASQRTDIKDMPAYQVYEAMLYNEKGHANVNVLEKVVIVTSENAKVAAAAKKLRKHITESGREAEVFNISIGGKSLASIESQMVPLFEKQLVGYKNYEIAADYTGGTKDMSAALLRLCDKELVLPLYLQSASDTNHSRYQ